MVFIDPICYRFCFGCVTPGPHEPFLKTVYQQLMAELKPFMIPFLKECFLISCERSKGERGLLISVEMVPGMINGHDVIERYWDDLFTALQDDALYGFRIDCMPEHDFKKYGPKKTKYTRRYMQLFSLLNERRQFGSYLPENCQLIQEVLDCPNDDLSDIVVPLRHVRNSNPFEVSLYAVAVGANETKETRFTLVTSRDGIAQPGWLHQLNLIIPRFMLGEQSGVFAFQTSWVNAMKTLGEHYNTAFGTIGMDAPPALYVYHGSSCYDDEAVRWHSKRYFDQYIPGYGWCTLLNAHQYAMTGNTENFTERLHPIQLANGNVITVLNGDMQRVTREEAQSVRAIFKPFLPPSHVRFSADGIPPSFRLGFTPDEIHYIGNDIYSFELS